MGGLPAIPVCARRSLQDEQRRLPALSGEVHDRAARGVIGDPAFLLGPRVARFLAGGGWVGLLRDRAKHHGPFVAGDDGLRDYLLSVWQRLLPVAHGSLPEHGKPVRLGGVLCTRDDKQVLRGCARPHRDHRACCSRPAGGAVGLPNGVLAGHPDASWPDCRKRGHRGACCPGLLGCGLGCIRIPLFAERHARVALRF